MARKTTCERYGRRGSYIEFGTTIAPRLNVKSPSATIPKRPIKKNIWRHPEYGKIILDKVKGRY